MLMRKHAIVKLFIMVDGRSGIQLRYITLNAWLHLLGKHQEIQQQKRGEVRKLPQDDEKTMTK